MNKTVWLIRHGESAANAGQASPSPSTIPLTQKGIQQARLFAEYFPAKPDLIVTSPYLRTQQTGQPLIERFSSIQVETWNVHEFTYLNPVRCGLSTMAERKPLIEEFWQRCEANYCDGEGAESFVDFTWRIKKTLDELKQSPKKKIIVFTHGQFIRSLMWLVLTRQYNIGNQEMKQIYKFMVSVPYPNTAFIKLLFVEQEAYISSILTEHLPSELISF